MSTPELQLRTLFVLDDRGRIVRNREPSTNTPAAFQLIRGARSHVWACRHDVPDDVATELGRLATSEPHPRDLEQPPVHADRYVELLGGNAVSGPAFVFPVAIPDHGGAVLIEDMDPLRRHFADVESEFGARSPICGVIEDGDAVCLCTTSRDGDEAYEAGLFTIDGFRGRGYGPRATAAWARGVRDLGRIPLYSTDWTNTASRAVARKLNCIPYASDWRVTT